RLASASNTYTCGSRPTHYTMVAVDDAVEMNVAVRARACSVPSASRKQPFSRLRESRELRPAFERTRPPLAPLHIGRDLFFVLILLRFPRNLIASATVHEATDALGLPRAARKSVRSPQHARAGCGYSLCPPRSRISGRKKSLGALAVIPLHQADEHHPA